MSDEIVRLLWDGVAVRKWAEAGEGPIADYLARVNSVPVGFRACDWKEATKGGAHNMMALASNKSGGVELVLRGPYNPDDIIWLCPASWIPSR